MGVLRVYSGDDPFSDFEREVLLEALSEYVERGTVQAPLRTAAGELHARRIAAARDLTLRLA